MIEALHDDLFLSKALAEANVPNGPGDCSISMDIYRIGTIWIEGILRARKKEKAPAEKRGRVAGRMGNFLLVHPQIVLRLVYNEARAAMASKMPHVDEWFMPPFPMQFRS